MNSGDDISIQVSLYPLADVDITQQIFGFLEIFQSHGLRYTVGSMSTIITGDTRTVFDALEAAYRHAASQTTFVLVCTMSNGAPTEKEVDLLNSGSH